MASKQPKRDCLLAIVREFHGHRFRYLGQLDYEGVKTGSELPADPFCGVGVRLYQDLDNEGQYLCVDSSETGEEAWYRVDGARLLADEE